MQKQKIDFYLTLQNTYDNIEIAIFTQHDLIEKKTINKLESSKNLIPEIDAILTKNNLKLENLNFIAVNKGPGPFTTLRVVITTVNALNFATNIPLIGIDGLLALQEEFYNESYKISVAILNAYNNDVYYSIKSDDFNQEGWQNIDLFLSSLKSEFKDHKIRFIGNGVDIFKSQIIKTFDNLAEFINPNPQNCSIEQIAKMAYKNWQNKENISKQIIPLYLKDAIK